MQQIILKHAEVDNKIALGVADCLDRIARLPVKQVPSVAEGITWAQYLAQANITTITADSLDNALFMLVKNKKDYDIIKPHIKELTRGL